MTTPRRRRSADLRVLDALGDVADALPHADPRPGWTGSKVLAACAARLAEALAAKMEADAAGSNGHGGGGVNGRTT